jgi:hypothetical protein
VVTYNSEDGTATFFTAVRIAALARHILGFFRLRKAQMLKSFSAPYQVVSATDQCICAVLEIDPAKAAKRLTVAAAAEQADRLTPILCAFTPGADPIIEVSMRLLKPGNNRLLVGDPRAVLLWRGVAVW